MRLNSLLLPLLLALASQAVAHGPVVEVSGLKVVHGDDGIFLEAQLDPPEGGATLIAASTPFGSALLESRNGGGYHAIERIPVSHEQGSLGSATSYRVRLPEISSGERTVPVTLLFNGGSVVQSEAELPAPSADYRPWAGAAVAVVLVLLGLRIAGGKRSALKRSNG